MKYMWIIIVLIIVAVVAFVIKSNNDKAKAEQLEKEKAERAKKTEAEAKAKKDKFEVFTEAEKQQLLKLEGEARLKTTLDVFEQAKKGNTTAMTLMGVTYQRIKVPSKAVYWFEKSSKLGNAEGLYWYGECFVSGYGVPENRTKGISMIMDAATKGNKSAIEALKENGMTNADLRSIGVNI